MTRWRLEFELGGQYSLRPGATSLGRHPTCDIILTDSTVSRRQLLLNTRVDGVELIKLGRQSVRCNERELDEEAVLAGSGDVIVIGGRPFATLRVIEEPASEPPWLLSVDGSPGLSLGHAPFAIGGGAEDHFVIPDWPAGAAQLHALEDAVIIELSDALRAQLEPSERARLGDEGFLRAEPGHSLRVAGHDLAVTASASAGVATTQFSVAEDALIRLESYRRGGVITIERGAQIASVYLSALRFALLRALLCPPSPHAPGEFIELEQLCALIWPDKPLKNEYDFNVLLHRVRQDLVRAKLDVDAFIERAHGSGRVRAPIAIGAQILDQVD
ncbi:FHA domain-containing protein [Pseudenhygromyxa sp. WMMC2535]|uniref:FHA domain-containing protein n=1 Tax=Pseudenhygromyxa sp. WMMC2535 TaxID=2712867 RepID=UPI00155283A9|nr:FHA domain-containing protein [Pseudenhygromyxa sp. WMMC2535]